MQSILSKSAIVIAAACNIYIITYNICAKRLTVSKLMQVKLINCVLYVLLIQESI